MSASEPRWWTDWVQKSWESIPGRVPVKPYEPPRPDCVAVGCEFTPVQVEGVTIQRCQRCGKELAE